MSCHRAAKTALRELTLSPTELSASALRKFYLFPSYCLSIDWSHCHETGPYVNNDSLKQGEKNTWGSWKCLLVCSEV